MSNLLQANQLKEFLLQLNLPAPNSRKGNNGKLLIIGGSQLFHAASRWSLDVASRLVDMVFYSSVPSNNQLIEEAKAQFWNGIVVPRQELTHYIEEADCILIGPGMERQPLDLELHLQPTDFYRQLQLSDHDWDHHTQKVTNYLLASHPQKRWVIDAGALQMISPTLLTASCVITPHHKELKVVLENAKFSNMSADNQLDKLSTKLGNCTILLKGRIDQVLHHNQHYKVEGGNPGLTKGGTGDVLAGLLAGLYTNSEILPSTIVASHINKLAGDELARKVGPFYNASDLVEVIPKVLWREIGQARQD